MSHHLASAVFDSHEEAQRAVTDLRTSGISDSHISLIAHHGGTTTTTSGEGEITDEEHRNVLRGILGGGALGAGLGVAALAIPGVGPLVAAGAIAAAAVPSAIGIGAAVGAAVGSLNEALTKHGIEEDDATYYSGRLTQGGVIVSVDDTSAIGHDQAAAILQRNGGHNAANAR